MLGPSRIIQSFDWLCPTLGYVPTCSYLVCHGFSYCYEAIRLACLIHAASVHPELGSNSNEEESCFLRSLGHDKFRLMPQLLTTLARSKVKTENTNCSVFSFCPAPLFAHVKKVVLGLFKDKTKENAQRIVAVALTSVLMRFKLSKNTALHAGQ